MRWPWQKREPMPIAPPPYTDRGVQSRKLIRTLQEVRDANNVLENATRELGEVELHIQRERATLRELRASISALRMESMNIPNYSKQKYEDRITALQTQLQHTTEQLQTALRTVQDLEYKRLRERHFNIKTGSRH